MQLDDVLDKYRQAKFSNSDLGTKFEELMARYLMTDQLYSARFEWVKQWGDFFGRKDISGHDTGIDLVAKTLTGEFWAIQCKCYEKDHYVSKGDVDTFMSASGRRFRDEEEMEISFSGRYIIATTDNWSSNAVEATENQTIPVIRVGLNILRNASVDWKKIEEGLHGSDAELRKYELKDHQKEALNNAVKHFKENDRGQMIMACGTGKTFTSMKIAEEFTKIRSEEGCILFLAPSIALVGQTLREWTAQSEIELNTICVCSDPKASKKITKKSSNDDLDERIEDLGAPATTDPRKIISQYKNGKGLTTIFSTYQSIDSLVQAQAAGLPEFDLIICDEAHRTTGVKIDDGRDESYFTRVHSNDNLKAKRRLYMTATPRLYGAKGKDDAKKISDSKAITVTLCSMDDESIYGKVFYKIGFGQAVEKELLTDYKVLILTTTNKDVPEIVKKIWAQGGKEIDADTGCKIWGCINALAKNVAYDETLKTTDPGKMKSAVSFCRTITRSKELMKQFNDMARTPMSPMGLSVKHIDGSMNAMERDRLLNWLKNTEDECKVLSNVRCLSEGVDVPALDAVMFMDSKNSLIDVVQSVGRVMRKSPGKKYGYIVIPIVVPDEGDPEDALDDNERYKTVWQVLRALRSHDERLDAEINTIQYSNKNRNKHVHIARLNPDADMMLSMPDGQFTLDDFGGALLARLVVKVGDRDYIENWAKGIAEIMPNLMERLEQICRHDEHGYKGYKPAFNRYLKGLRACVNDNVSENDAINMLAQQIVTKPIFRALFGDDQFVRYNSVSQTIDAMLEEIDAKNGLEGIDLSEFYDSVERTLSKIDATEGKQKVVTSLYEKFFKNAFPKDQAINGVVYTPQEIVDFIIRSAAGVLEQEFGINISDENVNVLDPFTGTGTFIARLMELGVISPKDVERKFRNELFANEITLLAYYIAAVNIENTFARLTKSKEYVPFDHIILTDTFNMNEIAKGHQAGLFDDAFFKRNMNRIREEINAPITVIVGNPPYGGRQNTVNDDAKKRSYDKGIDRDIEREYLDDSLFDGKKGNVNSVYDNYIRAFRWSTDRIGDNDGIIAFVTPNGWLTGSAFEGFRKCVEKEFSKIYIFNLRGNKGQTDELRRIEGRNIFEYSSDRGGCTIGIAITLLVKNKGFKGKAKIFYKDISELGDRLKGQEKRNLVQKMNSFTTLESQKQLEILNTKENGDWIVERDERFQKLIPINGDIQKFEKHNYNSVFVGYTLGYATHRDPWAYNFSKEKTIENMSSMIDEYNNQLESGLINNDSKRISWGDLKKKFEKNEILHMDSEKICQAAYRPFVKKWLYYGNGGIDAQYKMPKLFPSHTTKNLSICVSGIGVKKDFSCLITDRMTDLEIVGKSQCFPLCWYEDPGENRVKNKQITLDGNETNLIRHDSVSDYILNFVKQKYDADIKKKDVFYYVYGYLHSPEYRAAFREDLKLSLPRIDFVENVEDFWKFSWAGKELAKLHLNYENQKVLESVIVKGDRTKCHIDKMKVMPEERKIVYNQHITIENIPGEAFEYQVNGRTALGWLENQYQYSVDKDSEIVNDPNEYAGSEYVLNLVLSMITVSVETVEIVKGLPKLGLSENVECSQDE